MAERRVRLRIHGLVQGVNFRYLARQRARALGLRGWVRNRPEGTVEAVAVGPADGVDQFISWARQGPSSARVDRLDLEDDDCDEQLAGFQIR